MILTVALDFKQHPVPSLRVHLAVLQYTSEVVSIAEIPDLGLTVTFISHDSPHAATSPATVSSGIPLGAQLPLLTPRPWAEKI